jgi:uncharacterized protein
VNLSFSHIPSKAITIYVNADACPVKQEIYRVTERHALKGTALQVFVVTNTLPLPRDPLIGAWSSAPKLTSIPQWGTVAYAWPPGIGDRTARLPAASG